MNARESLLHDAICRAVLIMNMSIDIATSADGRAAKDILRQALIDYADAAPRFDPDSAALAALPHQAQGETTP